MYLWTHHTYPVEHRYYYFNHISPLHRYDYTWHHLCLLHASLIHRYTISLELSLHIFVTSFPGYATHSYFMFLHHCYIDSLVYMHWLSMYSCCIDHGLYYWYMDIPVFPLHDCFPLLDMWTVDTWCVELSATWIKVTGATSRISHLSFLVSRYLISCYQQSSCHVIMLHVSCIILVPDILCS